MHGLYINVLIQEYRSRHEGPVPTVPALLREPWVGAYLRVMFPPPAPALKEQPVSASVGLGA